MPRTVLTKTTAPGSTNYTGTALTMTAADTSNLNEFVAAGKDLIVAHNTGASSYTITVTSAADPYGRTKDISTVSIAAGAYMVFGPLELTGWQQGDGRIYLQASNAAVKFGVVSL
jgi:hypothetical protein